MTQTRREQYQAIGSYQLRRQELSVLADHYQKKYGVKVIVDWDRQAKILQETSAEKLKEDRDIVDYFKRRWQYPPLADYPYPPRFDPSWKKHELDFLAKFSASYQHREISTTEMITENSFSDQSPENIARLTNAFEKLVTEAGIQNEVEAELKSGKYKDKMEYFKYLVLDLDKKLQHSPFITYPHLPDPFAYYAPAIKSELEKAGFLGPDGNIRELTATEHQALKSLLDNMTKKLGINKKIYEHMEEFKRETKDPRTKRQHDNLPRMLQHHSTRFEDIPADVREIQRHLKEGETVGYASTTSTDTKGLGHVEFLLITENSVIKPVEWNIDEEHSISAQQIPGLISVSLRASQPLQIAGKEFVTEKNPEGVVVPQTGDRECVTLGLMYVIGLLKDNGKQLTESTLSVPIYFSSDENTEPFHLFIPSPLLLRYSQSDLYNQMIFGMIQSSEDQVSIEYKGKTFTAKSLEKLLKDSILVARERGLEDEARKIEKIVESLPAFREKWKREYETADEKRKEMDFRDDGKVVNRYLENKTRRLEHHAKTSTSEAMKALHINPAAKQEEKKSEPAPAVSSTASVVKPTTPGVSRFATRARRPENIEQQKSDETEPHGRKP